MLCRREWWNCGIVEWIPGERLPDELAIRVSVRTGDWIAVLVRI